MVFKEMVEHRCYRISRVTLLVINSDCLILSKDIVCLQGPSIITYPKKIVE